MTIAALVIYAFLLAAAAHLVWRRPVVALYAFIVGLALHNAAMDALYGAGIQGHALTAIQAWKDVLLIVAFVRVVYDAVRARALPFRPQLPDAFALGFAAIVVLYALIPQHALGGHATHKAIAYALRHDLEPIGAYIIGRAVIPNLEKVRWLVLVTAAAVAAWGLIDVYAIDLSWWRHNGTVGYFDRQLGFPYGRGLSGLPENFAYSNGNEHQLVRRLVSTFLSPLGAAYICLVALLTVPRKRVAIPFAALAAIGLLWTHTRAAVIALAVGFVVMTAVWRKLWPLGAAAATVVVGLAVVAVFPQIGPRAHFTPAELQVQRAHARVSGKPTLEPSAESHLSNLRDGIRTVIHHPQGYGLGNAGEVAFRAGVPLKAGESNYTEIGVETGLLGALLFIAWNLAILGTLAVRCRPILAATFAAVLVVAIQTDAYGIPWLGFIAWWLAGSGVSLPSARRARVA
ncbi:MAG: O-antigen ligase family protein [Gaiellaceae bacterium]